MAKQGRKASRLYTRFLEQSREIAHLKSAQALLSWDMQTIMPPGGDGGRAPVMATVEAASHRLQRAKPYVSTIEKLLSAAERGELDERQAANVRRTWSRVRRAIAMPESFVREREELFTSSHAVWERARDADDFGLFLPTFERIVDVKRREAELVGYADSPYDALIDEFEPGATAATMCPLLERLTAFLVPFLKRIMESPHQPHPAIAKIAMRRDDQERLCRFVAERIGFDFSHGRLDGTAHPFASRIHPGDVRITTRFDELDLLYALSSVMHEAGHGMFDQALPTDEYGTEASECSSMGLHESQSRLWEVIVGMSLPFWRFLHPHLVEIIGPGIPSLDDLYRSINRVQPTCIRAEADEVTYNLHVGIRVKLERAMILGEMPVKDARDAWNALYRERLGIEPTRDSEGIIQDVHWAHGYIGYFLTYGKGNVCAPQFVAAFAAEMPDWEARIARGKFDSLLAWLISRVYLRSGLFDPEEIVRGATGSLPDPSFLIAYLTSKYSDIYGI